MENNRKAGNGINLRALNSINRAAVCSLPSKTHSPAAQQKRPLGIYLHIPFCVRKCLYCDFLSMTADAKTAAAYVNALCRQIQAEAPGFGQYRVNSIFLGGGTPSLLNGDQLTRILQTVYDCFEVEADAEITMESNPGTLNEEKLTAYRKAGVNRLSMGLQSADDQQLKSLGRVHTWKDFQENYQAARKAGFSNINVDLMSALPGQSAENWLETLEKVAMLAPEHISAYSLIIEEGTPFYDRYGADGDTLTSVYPPLPDEEEERLMYVQTEALLQKYGYHRYEISNYAKTGRECRHNVGNWNRTEYLGFGIGAASLVKEHRFRVISSLQEYLRIMEEWDSSAADKSDEGPEQIRFRIPQLYEEIRALQVCEQMEEFMFLGLRLTQGISPERFERQFGKHIDEVYGQVLQKLENQELICFDEEYRTLKLTQRGIDVSNCVLAQFLLDED